jgi:D-alanine-D-alanine ligase
MPRTRVGILFGGRSAEHEISILSARNVVAALDRERFDPILIGIAKDGRWLVQDESSLLHSPADPRRVKLDLEGLAVAMEPWPNGGTLLGRGGPLTVDVMFPVLHGPMGEDGTIQGLLELAGIPYVGAGILGSAVGMDKDVMKRLLREARIPVADFRVVRRFEMESSPRLVLDRVSELGFPLFTKPANLGSSIGVRKVPGRESLQQALRHAFEFDVKVIAESAIAGREIECSVLGASHPIPSVAGEIIVTHPDRFYSYDAKYIDESGSELRIPAPLEPGALREVQDLAVRTFKSLECHGLARVDLFLKSEGDLLVNEINTLPGFTRISMYPKLWEASGMTQTALTSRLIDLALERRTLRAGIKTSHEFGVEV